MASINVAQHIRSTRQARPQIYAYTTPEIARHAGWTKIGYTDRDVQTRIREQTHTAGVAWNLEWQGNATFEDGSGTFRDHDFHGYLRKLEYAREPDTEWFEISGAESKSRFYEFRENRGILAGTEATVEYHLRAEQEQAVAAAAQYFRAHEGGEFLWNAKPRFGKTLAAYNLCKRLAAKRVLIVTNRPAIANSWYEDYEKFVGASGGYLFVSDNDSLKKAPYCLTRAEWGQALANPDMPEGLIEFLSLQDLKGSVNFGGTHNKLGHIAEQHWDVLIIDEAHEGVDTFKTAVAFDQITRTFTLHLSGTPFKAIANEKFPEEAIFNWTYADEQSAKAEWADSEKANPYEELPRLNMFTYQMSDIVEDEARQGIEVGGESMEYAFELSEFFATNQSGFFLHEAAVDTFLDSLTAGEKFPFSTPELRAELRHTFWLLNRVDSARALAKKLKAHPIFSEYEIVVAAGDGRLDGDDMKAADKSLARVRKAIAEHEYTITLSVGQLTTGVTVPEWTGVLMLSTMKSPALYMQAAFRAQNPCLFACGGEYLRKENAYVFDFDPARTLTIYEQFATDLYPDTASGAIGTGDARKNRIRTLLNFFPVIGEDEHGQMIELDAERVLSIPRKIRSHEVVRRGFMSDFLFHNIANVFRAPQEVIDTLHKFEPFKEPTKPVDITEHTAGELSLNERGEVEIPSEQIIGTATDIFGPKAYERAEKKLQETVDSLTLSAKGKEDEALKHLEAAFVHDVADPLIAAAKENYGKELSAGHAKRIEKKIRAGARVEFAKKAGAFNMEAAKIERDRAAALENAASAEEEATIHAESRERFEAALANFTASMKESAEELIHGAGETIVGEVETAKREEKKHRIEGGIRDHLRGFARTIPSFLMAYGDEQLTLANFDDYTEDDVFKEVTGISEEEFRRLRDGFDYVDEATGEQRRFEGGLFDEVVFNDSVQEFLRLRRELADYFDDAHEHDIFDYIPPQKTNQIFTPRAVVTQMVDALEEQNPGCFNNPDVTFADLYMKSGLYITEIVKRLFAAEGLKKAFPDESERIRHILGKQVYGMAPTRIIYLIAMNYIFAFDEDLRTRAIDGKLPNFAQADSAAAAKEGRLKELVDECFGSATPQGDTL